MFTNQQYKEFNFYLETISEHLEKILPGLPKSYRWKILNDNLLLNFSTSYGERSIYIPIYTLIGPNESASNQLENFLRQEIENIDRAIVITEKRLEEEMEKIKKYREAIDIYKANKKTREELMNFL